jgi:hypothetical protein
MKHVVMILCSAIYLMACEGNTARIWKVDNQTDGILKVQINSDSDSNSLSVTRMCAGEIIRRDQLGGSDTPGPPDQSFTELLIILADDTLQTDYTLTESWQIESDHLKKVPSHWQHEFTLVVNDEGFE